MCARRAHYEKIDVMDFLEISRKFDGGKEETISRNLTESQRKPAEREGKWEAARHVLS